MEEDRSEDVASCGSEVGTLSSTHAGGGQTLTAKNGAELNMSFVPLWNVLAPRASTDSRGVGCAEQESIELLSSTASKCSSIFKRLKAGSDGMESGKPFCGRCERNWEEDQICFLALQFIMSVLTIFLRES